MVWNPGDDTGLNEGGADSDSVAVNAGAEVFTTTANGTRVRFDRLDPAPFSLDIGTSERLVLNAHGGNDQFSATGNLAPLIQITVDGGAGGDRVLGSNGADRCTRMATSGKSAATSSTAMTSPYSSRPSVGVPVRSG